MVKQFDKVVVKSVVGIGNQPDGTKFFTTRPDVQPHFHKPGDYYCGRCMRYVRI